MDLRSLNYFTVVARELNFSRAAEKLCMSQPPLSNCIHQLEEELGVTLFVRGKRSLTLTDAGQLLLRRSEQLLDLASRTRDEMTGFGKNLSGTLFIDSVEGRAAFITARLIAGFMEEFPEVRYELWNGSGDDVIDRLHRGQSDLAIVASPYDSEHLEGIPVGAEEWVAMMSTEHPLASEPGDTIPLSVLAGHPLCIPRRKSRVDAIFKWFAGIGAEPQVLCEHSSYLNAVSLARANVGISIFPRTVPEPPPGVVSKVITGPAKMAEYVLVWERDRTPARLPEAFIEFAADTVPKNDIMVDEAQLL